MDEHDLGLGHDLRVMSRRRVLGVPSAIRSDITTSFSTYSVVDQGVPMKLTLNLRDLAENTSGAGMAVYVWHCDREGRYSLYSEGVTEQNYPRGVQVADANGTVEFTSIFPACYAGRWPHIHFEVYDSLASDNVFGDGWDAELATVTGTPASRMDVSLTIGVAEKSQNTQSDNSFPGGQPPNGDQSPGGRPPSGNPPR